MACHLLRVSQVMCRVTSECGFLQQTLFDVAADVSDPSGALRLTWTVRYKVYTARRTGGRS